MYTLRLLLRDILTIALQNNFIFCPLLLLAISIVLSLVQFKNWRINEFILHSCNNTPHPTIPSLAVCASKPTFRVSKWDKNYASKSFGFYEPKVLDGSLFMEIRKYSIHHYFQAVIYANINTRNCIRSIPIISWMAT